MNHGSRVDVAVQDDGQSSSHILAGDISKDSRPRAVQRERDNGLIGIRIELHPGRGKHITRQHGLLLEEVRDTVHHSSLRVQHLFIEDLGAFRNLSLEGFLHDIPVPAPFIHHLELEQSGLPDELDCPFRILDPWKLDDDPTIPLSLDERLPNPKLIHPVSDLLDVLLDCLLLNHGHLPAAQSEQELGPSLLGPRHLRIVP